jgi:hypothetical protein
MKMNTAYVPYGKDMLNPVCPDAKFDCSGLFEFDGKYFTLLDKARGLFDCVLPIASVHGCFPVMWNGGRVVRPFHSPGGAPLFTYDGWTPEILIQQYNSRGINVTYTFSNHLITEEHLDDPSSNYLLDLLGRQQYDGNGVIISSDVLSDYIRSKYPHLKQTASVAKADTEMPNQKGGRSFDYYDKLADRFDKVNLQPDDNFDKPLLEQIVESGEVNQYVILLNERCVRGCQTRNLHYDAIARTNMSGYHGIFKYDTMHFSNPYAPTRGSGCHATSKMIFVDGNPNRDHQVIGCSLKRDELREIYDMGFRNFKIQGRGNDWMVVCFDLLNYMLEPEVVFPLFFK